MPWEKLIVCFATVSCYCNGIRLKLSSSVYKMSSGSKDVIKKDVPAIEDANININQSEEYFETLDGSFSQENVENNTSYASATLHDDSLKGQEKVVSVQSLHADNSPYAINEEDPDASAKQHNDTPAQRSSNTENSPQGLADDEESSSDDSSQSSDDDDDDDDDDAGERSVHSRAEKPSSKHSRSKRQPSKKETPVSENEQTSTAAREEEKEIPKIEERKVFEKRLREWQRDTSRWRKSIPPVHLIEHTHKLSTRSTTSGGERASGWKDGIPVPLSQERKPSDGAETPDSFTGWEHGIPVFPSFEGSISSVSEEILTEETFYNDEGVPASSLPRQEHGGSSSNVPEPPVTKKVRVSTPLLHGEQQEGLPSRSSKELSSEETVESKEFSDAIACVTAPTIPPIQEEHKRSPDKEFSNDFVSPRAQEDRLPAASSIQEHKRSPSKEFSDALDSLTPQEDKAPAITLIQEAYQDSPSKEFSDALDSLSPEEVGAPVHPSIQEEHKGPPSKEFPDATDSLAPQDAVPAIPSIQEEHKGSPSKEFSDATESLAPQDAVPTIPLIQEEHKESPSKEFSDALDSLSPEEVGLPVHPSIQEEHKGSPSKEFSDALDFLTEERLPASPLLTEDLKASPHEVGKKLSGEQQTVDSFAELEEVELSLPGEIKKKVVFDVVSTGETDQLLLLQPEDKNAKQYPIKDQSKYAAYLVIVELQSDSEDTMGAESVEPAEHTGTLSGMNIEVLKWTEEGTPEIIRISAKSTQGSVPLSRVVHQETVIRGRRRTLINVTCLKAIEETCSVESKEPEIESVSPKQALGGIKDVTEDYIAADVVLKYTDEDEDMFFPSLSSMSFEHLQKGEEIAAVMGTSPQLEDDGRKSAEVMGTSPQLEEDGRKPAEVMGTSPKLEEDGRKPAEVMGTSPQLEEDGRKPAEVMGTSPQLEEDGRKPAEFMGTSPQLEEDGRKPAEVMGTSPKLEEDGRKPAEVMGTSPQLEDDGRKPAEFMGTSPKLEDVGRKPVEVMGTSPKLEDDGRKPAEVMGTSPKLEDDGRKPVEVMGTSPKLEDDGRKPAEVMGTSPELEDVGRKPVEVMGTSPKLEDDGRKPVEVMGTSPELEDVGRKSAEVMGTSPKLEDDGRKSAEVMGTSPKLEDDGRKPAEAMGTSPKLEDDGRKPAEVMGTSPKLEDDGRKPAEAMLTSPLMQDTTESRTKEEAYYDEELETAKAGDVERIIRTEDLSEVLLMEVYLDCETCPCGPCVCSGKVEVPGTCNNPEQYTYTVNGSVMFMQSMEVLDNKPKRVCKMLEQCICSPCTCSDCDHKKNISVQTGGIYLIADDEEALDKDSNFLQVLNDAAVILKVKASVIDPEPDSSGSLTKTAVISIRPIMVGPLAQHTHTASEDDVGEAVLKPVSTRAFSFLMLLDENGKQQETMSDLKERVHAELLQQDTGLGPIIEEWQSTMSVVKQTSESFAQGLVSMLPEILLAKGLCSMDTNGPTRTSGTVAKDAGSIKKESSFIIIDSPASSTVDDAEKHQTYTNRESENPHTETGLSVSDKVDEHRLETGSKVINSETGQSGSTASTSASELQPEEPNIEDKQSGSEEMIASSFKIGLSIREDLIASVLISNLKSEEINAEAGQGGPEELDEISFKSASNDSIAESILESEEPNTETGKGTPDDLDEDSFIIGSTIIQEIIASISESTLKLKDPDTLATSLSEAEVQEAPGTLTEDAPTAAADRTEDQSKSSGDSETSQRQTDNLDDDDDDDDEVYYDALDHFET